MRSAPESILLLLPSLTGLGGGIELYLRQFLEALVEARPTAELTCVLAREPRLQRPELLSPGLRERLRVVGTRSERRTPRVVEFLARAGLEIARRRPTLVVCGHVNYAATSYAIARATGARLMVLTYGIEAWNLARPLTVRALRGADRILTISRFTASQLSRSLEVAPQQIAIVHNAVDTQRFTPGAPSATIEAKLADLARPRLLTVCRLDATEVYKGVDTVLRVLAQRPALAGSYLVVGDGSDRPRLERLATELGVPARFYGRAPDEELVDLYRACDLFVMPSHKEGFGYVFIEAMACGVPVVAGNIDGSVDALADGELGVLANPSDEQAVGDAIAAQLEGKTPDALRDPLRLHAEVAQRFSHAAFRRQLEKALG